MSDDLIREARGCAEYYRLRRPSNTEPISDIDKAFARLVRHIDRLADALEAARAKETAIRDNIPMSFLRTADMPGATGPTEHLDLVKAIRLMTEKSRECATRAQAAEAQAERLAEALQAAYCWGGPTKVNQALAAYEEWRDGAAAIRARGKP